MDEATAAVLERLSAFIPKEAKRAPAQILERPPLGELTTDEKTVSSFEFYFNRITGNAIGSDAELRARMAQNLSNNGGLLDISRTAYITAPNSNNIVQVPEKERISITDPAQEKLLLDFYKEGVTTKEARSNNEKTVAALKFYVNRIFQEKIVRIDELQARMAQNLSSNGGLLNTERNAYIVEANSNGSGGRIIQVPENERFVVQDPQQKAFLLDLLAEIGTVRAEKIDSDRSVKTLKFYVEKILSGSLIGVNELQARFAQNLSSNGGLLNTAGNGYIARPGNGQIINVPEAERFKVDDPKQVKLFVDIYNFINEQNVPEEIRGLLGKYFSSNSTADLERVRLLLQTKNGGLLERAEDLVERFNTIKRKSDLQQQFYTKLLEPNTNGVTQALDILTGYTQQSSEDTALVVTLRDKALDVRRITTALTFTDALAKSDRNFDSTLALIETLEKSTNQKDITAGRTLRATLYRLELAIFRDEVRKMIKLDTDPKEIDKFIDALPKRPSAQNIDYIQSLSKLKETVADFYRIIGKISQLKTANEIRRSFPTGEISVILARIKNLPTETEQDEAVKTQLLDLYKNFVAANKPDSFDTEFSNQLSSEIEATLKLSFSSPELGQNKEAFKYMRENFVRVIFPLVEAFRDDPKTKADVEKFLQGKSVSDDSPRWRFLQRLSDLEKQRPLTEIERNYIKSVELLTLFNPYLVATASAEFGVTNEFLRHHFETLSEETKSQIKEGDYIPLLQIGTGPNGLDTFGEIVRNNPELARQTLVIDKAKQPGGPFAIPQGPAWELNSANNRGANGFMMPDAPNGTELKTVRAYGSPVARWFPGERSKGSDTRGGSINTTVDYLPTPDVISKTRYPTNEELQAVIQLQSSLLIQKLALNTELIKFEENPNKEEKGDHIATLKITYEDGTENILRVKTDGIFVASGLGDPKFGFKLEGSKAEKVMQTTSDTDTFPKISTTLEAFKAFADRTQEKKSPGKVLTIWGNGNSADTLIEFIGGIFQGDNPMVREVTKIYIITDGDLSSRPRYSLINDLKPRNGGGNLIELVNGRVADVDFTNSNGSPETRKIVVLDASGKVITDSQGKPIEADSGIAATGFSPQLDKIFASYLDGKSLMDEGDDAPLQSIVLPTNPNVAVAESLRANPNIVFLGTAARPRFDSLEKLAQIPKSAREALLRNGAENAVAIGFRGPDTQAAVNIWLNSRFVNLEPETPKTKPQIPLDGASKVDTQIEIDKTVDSENLAIPDNIEQEDQLLSPLVAYLLGNKFDLTTNFTGNVKFGLQYDQAAEKFSLTFKGGDVQNVSTELLGALKTGATDKFFQRYALSLLGKRRGDPKLDLNIAFQMGKMNPRNTFVQAV